MRFDRAAGEELDVFFALHDERARAEGDPVLDDAKRERLHAAAARDPPRVEVWLARERDAPRTDAPLAYVTLFESWTTYLVRPVLYLEDLYVTPRARRRGVGEAALGFVAREARRRECGRVAWVVDKENAPALALYRKLGARPFSRWQYHVLQGRDLEALAQPDAHVTGATVTRSPESG